MKYYKFQAKIINLDGSEIPLNASIYSNSKEEAERRFQAQIRTENNDYLEIKDFQYLGIHLWES